ncbi:MAG: helix-turn-helix domain-containing protein [Pseudomonadota bacterium]
MKDHRPFDSSCPIGRFADILGDRCALMIMRDLFQDGDRTFSQLRVRERGFSPNTLSQRLKNLEAAGLIEMVRYQDHPPRFLYRLTANGRYLGPVYQAIFDWGSATIKG